MSEVMNRSDVLEAVQEVLITAFQLPPESVTPDKNLYTDLDLDSLDAIDLAAELNNRTKIKFDNEDLRQIRTVADVVDAIIKKQAANP